MGLPWKREHGWSVLGLCFLLLLTSRAAGADFGYVRIESGGTRFGVPATLRSTDFRQADLLLKWALPVQWDVGHYWSVRPRFETTGGWLGNPYAEAAIGSAGPTFVFTHGVVPLSLEVGLSPTIISRWDFEDKNFGTPLQFTSYIGLNAELEGRFRLTYRFQHMSNGGLAKPNPGLNLHMVGLCYIF